MLGFVRGTANIVAVRLALFRTPIQGDIECLTTETTKIQFVYVGPLSTALATPTAQALGTAPLVCRAGAVTQGFWHVARVKGITVKRGTGSLHSRLGLGAQLLGSSVISDEPWNETARQ